jgi:putative nucleotidyltransferase with HDIG domain
VLKLVNSGFCGFRKPISSIQHAMVLLGLDAARSVVLSAPIVDMFEEMCRHLEGLWEHSLATARAAQALAELVKLPQPEEAGVAGLLHDFGKVVIAECLPEEAARIRRIVAERNCLQIDAEREVLKVTHQEVGQWLLKKWSLPSNLIYPIAYHNNFHPSRDHALPTAIVHVADILVRARGVGFPGDHRVPAIHPGAWELLDISFEDVAWVMRHMSQPEAA